MTSIQAFLTPPSAAPGHWDRSPSPGPRCRGRSRPIECALVSRTALPTGHPLAARAQTHPRQQPTAIHFLTPGGPEPADPPPQGQLIPSPMARNFRRPQSCHNRSSALAFHAIRSSQITAHSSPLSGSPSGAPRLCPGGGARPGGNTDGDGEKDGMTRLTKNQRSSVTTTSIATGESARFLVVGTAISETVVHQPGGGENAAASAASPPPSRWPWPRPETRSP